MREIKRATRIKSETELNYIKLKKRYSSMLAIARKMLKNKDITPGEKKETQERISELEKKREEVQKQIKYLSKTILQKQFNQLINIDTAKLNVITKTEANNVLTQNLFEDNLDEFVKKLT
jgi:hypothetical protein